MPKCVECRNRGEWEHRYGKLYMRCKAPKPPTTDFISRAEAHRDSPCDQYHPLKVGEHVRLYASQADMGKDLKAYPYLIGGVNVKGVKRNIDGCTYEVYGCRSRDTALDFLRCIPGSAIPPLHYVIVETPCGNVGKDINCLFDEDTGNPLA